MKLNELIAELVTILKEDGNVSVIGDLRITYPSIDLPFLELLDMEIMVNRCAHKPSKWHNIDDEPNNDRVVLVALKEGAIRTDCCLGRKRWQTYNYIQLSHWRELPKPPNKSK